jgi:hypothetical protein
MFIRFQLSILTILALLQPVIFFYFIRGNLFFMLLFTFLGLAITLIFILGTYKQRLVNRFNFIWSILILIIGFSIVSIPERWLYVADAMVFMKEREAIVKKIKASKDLNQQLNYVHTGRLPVSIDNYVVINEIETDKLNITFQTVDDGWLGIHTKGVMYSDKPEKIETYEKRRTEQGGVIDEYSFRIKKIKAHWYFYEYEVHNISD